MEPTNIYCHVWDDGNRSEGCIVGKINGVSVEFSIRHDTDSPQIPTSEPVYSRIKYLGVLDSDMDLDHSHHYPYDPTEY